jgi:CubicO group peptidase (beta-lactamase class C family)
MPPRNRLPLMFLLALAPGTLNAQMQGNQPYWPSTKWRTASPESQGLDSQVLASAVSQVKEKQLGVHSLLVIRHGYAVLDAYFYPYTSGTPHDLASVTKTLTSTLTGIAVKNGVLKLDQQLLSFFPAERPANPDERKRKITIEDTLRMQSGLDCGYLPGEQELEQMKRSENWVRYALSLPMKYEPGAHPSYCSPGYHLLGSAIAAAAHMKESDFARQYLFNPLGMKPGIWADDPQGRSHGWGDSHFLPEDVAKLGYLYLRGGEWNGQQIVDRDWVKMSTALPTGARTDPGGFGYEWNVSNGPNGLQFGGTGRGGQTLIVWPDLDMIVVSMAGGNAGQIASTVRQAVKSNQALPENPSAYAVLQAKAAEAAKSPQPEPITALPKTAASISGVVYEFPVNSSRLDSISLTFQSEGEAHVDVKYYGTPLSFPIGLDGIYRLGPHGPFHLLAGAKGKWTSDTEFLLDLNFVANINHYTLSIRFTGDHIDVTASEASGLIRQGHLIGARKS